MLARWFAFALGLVAFAPCAALAAERYNVLLICVDDLKPAVGCYGDPLAKTPSLDRLAARGTQFDLAYCNQAVCSPSRNALLTGLRPATLGVYDLPTNFRRGRPDALTLPQWFKQHGWRTEGLGKIFHVGHGNVDDAVSWSVPHWTAKVVAYERPENRPATGPTREEALFDNKPAAGLPKGAVTEAADVPDNRYPDGALADEAILRLKAAAQRPEEPFFIAVGFVKPHLPFVAPQKYWDLHDPARFALPALRKPPEGAPAFAPTSFGELRQYQGVPEQGPISDELTRHLIHGYYAATSYMDAQLGRVLDALDASGQAERTIIVLWGDHGWHLGDHGMWCKHTNYEQAARIPLVVVAPGVGKPGTRSGALVESVDVLPTLCELAGLPAPEGLDGRSFAAQLRDPAAAGEQAAIHYYPRGDQLGRAVRTARYRLVEWRPIGAAPETAQFELYDYETDPLETKNLAAERPEVVSQLRTLLAALPEPKPQVTARGGKQPAAGKPAARGKQPGLGKSSKKKQPAAAGNP